MARTLLCGTVHATLVCPVSVLSILGAPIRVCPLFSGHAQYFRVPTTVPTNLPTIFGRVPTIFVCPLFVLECSEFRPDLVLFGSFLPPEKAHLLDTLAKSK